jgi:hypothetical protein
MSLLSADWLLCRLRELSASIRTDGGLPDERRSGGNESLPTLFAAYRGNAGLWVEVSRLIAANSLKEMVGTRRLELLTSTVSIYPD